MKAENGKNSLVVKAVNLEAGKSEPVTVIVNCCNSRPQLAGAYNGLLVSGSGVARSNNRSGLVTLTVTSSGMFTGKVYLGGFALPISGLFDNEGVAHFNPTTTTAFAPTWIELVGKAKTPVPLGYLSLSIDINGSGRVAGNLTASNGEPRATLNAELACFSKQNPVAQQFLKNKGYYTAVLAPKGQPGDPARSLTTYPQGYGFGSVTVSPTGIATLKGSLADGTIVSAAAPLSQSYQWPCFAQLYGAAGSLAGMVSFDDSNPMIALAGVDLLWFRPVIPAAKIYKEGWIGGITVDLLGCEYAVPLPSEAKSALPGPKDGRLNAADEANGNATLEFSDGKLASPGGFLDRSVNIAPNNTVVNAPRTDKSFTLALTAASGLIGGSFTHTDHTRPAFQGVILQHEVGAGNSTHLPAGAYGFFLSAPSSGTGGTSESGGVTLWAK